MIVVTWVYISGLCKMPKAKGRYVGHKCLCYKQASQNKSVNYQLLNLIGRVPTFSLCEGVAMLELVRCALAGFFHRIKFFDYQMYHYA